jgi:hypothetical protein
VIHEQSGGIPQQVSEITHWFRRTYNISAEDRNVLKDSDFYRN